MELVFGECGRAVDDDEQGPLGDDLDGTDDVEGAWMGVDSVICSEC